jgi:hypothetical protein
MKRGTRVQKFTFKINLNQVKDTLSYILFQEDYWETNENSLILVYEVRCVLKRGTSCVLHENDGEKP